MAVDCILLNKTVDICPAIDHGRRSYAKNKIIKLEEEMPFCRDNNERQRIEYQIRQLEITENHMKQLESVECNREQMKDCHIINYSDCPRPPFTTAVQFINYKLGLAPEAGIEGIQERPYCEAEEGGE